MQRSLCDSAARTRAPITLLALVAILTTAGVAFAQEVSNLAVQEPGRGRLQTSAPTAAETETQRANAMTRFVRGDVHGALDALNQVGEPRITAITADGLVRTNESELLDYLGLHQGDLLTSGRLARAARRLDDFPMATMTRMRYDLLPDSAVLHPILVERTKTPQAIFGWVPVAVRAAFTQEVRVSLANLVGRHEVWSPSFRWAQGRPRLGLNVEAPAPGILPGNLRFETLWSRQEYATLDAAGQPDVFQEARTRAGVGLSDWLTGWLHWQAGTAFEHIAKASYVGWNGSLTTRFAGDRLSTNIRGDWFTNGDADSFRVGEASISARTTARQDRAALSGVVGYALASETSPLAMWPSASSGSGYTGLLRAHRLYSRGLLVGDAFGRELAFSTVEYTHPIPTRFGASALRMAGFVDAAQSRYRLQPTASGVLVDVGFGLRFNTSRAGSEVRLDVARGVRDDVTRVSAAYVQPWGER